MSLSSPPALNWLLSDSTLVPVPLFVRPKNPRELIPVLNSYPDFSYKALEAEVTPVERGENFSGEGTVMEISRAQVAESLTQKSPASSKRKKTPGAELRLSPSVSLGQPKVEMTATADFDRDPLAFRQALPAGNYSKMKPLPPLSVENASLLDSARRQADSQLSRKEIYLIDKRTAWMLLISLLTPLGTAYVWYLHRRWLGLTVSVFSFLLWFNFAFAAGEASSIVWSFLLGFFSQLFLVVQLGIMNRTRYLREKYRIH